MCLNFYNKYRHKDRWSVLDMPVGWMSPAPSMRERTIATHNKKYLMRITTFHSTLHK